MATPTPPSNLTTVEARVRWLRSLTPEERAEFSKATGAYATGPLSRGRGVKRAPDADLWREALDKERAERDAQWNKERADEAAKAAADKIKDLGGTVPDGPDSLLTEGMQAAQSQTDLLLDPAGSAFATVGMAPNADFNVIESRPDGRGRADDPPQWLHGLQGESEFGSARSRLQSLYDKDPEELRELQQKLEKAGFLGKHTPGIIGDATLQGYMQLLVQAARYNKSGDMVTPEELLEQAAADGAQSNTQTQTQINVSDPLTAQALIHSTLTRSLGRAPTGGEILNFTQALQAAEKTSPTTTTTTQTADGASSTTTGGMNANAFAADFVNDKYGKEIGTVNAATTLYEAAMSVLGAGGR